jgi:carboxypeptidase A2
MLTALITGIAGAALAQPLGEPNGAARYDGDKVVTVLVADEKARRTVMALARGLWTCSEPALGPMQVQVEAAALAAFDELGLAYVVDVDNVQALIDAENARLADAAREPGAPRGELPGAFFDDYRTNQQISDYMNALVAGYPDRVSRQPIGQSIEGREIYAMRITLPGSGPKPVILMNAVIHAREWITASTGCYIIDRLVRNPDSEARIEALLSDFEIVFVPVLNPDGYAYTWSNDRLWRKNRRPPPIGSGCAGVDNNRNWGSFWGLDTGSSGDPCNETYRGAGPFSEPEGQAMRDLALATPGVVAYVDVHSAGRYILSSWGQQQAPPEPVAELMDENNNRLMAAISAVNGTRFRGGPTFANLYPVSGGSHDWFLDSRGVLGWTWELRPDSGFIIPPSNILPAGREIFAGVLELGDIIRGNALRVRFTGPGRAVRASATGPTEVQIVVTRGFDAPDPEATRLWARIGRVGPFIERPLANLDAGVLTGTLPSAPCGAVVQYYVQALTASGLPFTSPPAGADEPFEAAVSDPEQPVAFDMESPAGWTASASWVNASPNGTAAQADHPQQGTRCWVTGNSDLPGGALSANDVDSATFVRLTSPSINLAGRNNLTVSYWRWFCANIGADPNLDTLVVEASAAGDTWRPVETVGPGGPQARRGWFHYAFRLDDVITPSATTRLRFSTRDQGGDTFLEAGLDNLVIYAERCGPTCPGDWTRDGSVEAQDVAAIIEAWFADQVDGKLRADFNRDGVSNSTDISDFINAWLTPC